MTSPTTTRGTRRVLISSADSTERRRPLPATDARAPWLETTWRGGFWSDAPPNWSDQLQWIEGCAVTAPPVRIESKLWRLSARELAGRMVNGELTATRSDTVLTVSI